MIKFSNRWLAQIQYNEFVAKYPIGTKVKYKGVSGKVASHFLTARTSNGVAMQIVTSLIFDDMVSPNSNVGMCRGFIVPGEELSKFVE